MSNICIVKNADDLDKIQFDDRQTAEKNIKQLASNLFDAKSFDRLYPNLVKYLAASPDPDLALTNFERYSSAVLNKTELYTFLSRNQIAFDYLIRLFSASQFITDVLIRNPEYFNWLLEDRELRMQKGYQEMCLELRSILASLQSVDRQYSALRRFHRRELLRIGARDILGLAEFRVIVAELSDLASGLLQIAIEMVTPEIQKKFGIPTTKSKTGFVVIGMGKLGGYELNFSSDIDILFVYDEEGETSVGISHYEYYNALAESVIQVLTKMTAQGYVYRVDMRLRPEGGAGPLARSLESYEQYYQAYAETWERIALIKSRPVAGDEAVGKQFTDLIVPFVYRRTLDYAAIEEIQNMKLRLQTEATKLVAVTKEVKSGVGGIREIEFTVSLLQLFYGGKEKSLRETNTLKVIKLLQEQNHLTESDAEKLTAAYTFLRQVEHRLQSAALLQTHTLPSSQEELQKLARKLGYQDQFRNQHSAIRNLKSAAELFQEEYKQHTEFVHTIFSNLFVSEKVTDAKTTQFQFEQFLNPAVSAEVIYPEIKQFGFGNPEQAYQNLQKLNANAGETVSPTHTRKLMLTILPNLFTALKSSPEPDTAFSRFEQYLYASKAANAVYSVLAQEPELATWIITLFSYSDYLSQILMQHPALFDIFMHSSEQTVISQQIQDLKLLPNLRDTEIFRIGLRDILHRIDSAALSNSMTHLAENGINLIYNKVGVEYFQPSLSERNGYAIFALGKLGAYEMTYGSDLDLIFVYDGDDYDISNKISEKVIQYSNDYFLPVDPRLRPEGGKGILALSYDGYAVYFKTRASFWERLAYTRARYLCGDNELGDKFQRLIHQFVYQSPVPKDIKTQVFEMRMKMQEMAEDKYPGGKHLKSGFGGLVDIEFILQYFQLIYGEEDEHWRTSKIELLFQQLREHKPIPEKDINLLHNNYQFISQLQNLVRLTTEITANVLPKEDSQLNRLAILMGFKSQTELLTECKKVTKSNRTILKNVLGIKDK